MTAKKHAQQAASAPWRAAHTPLVAAMAEDEADFGDLAAISELKADAPVPANPAEAASPAVEPTAAG